MTLFQHLRAACIAVLMGIGAAALPITAAQAADRIYTSLFSDDA